MLPPIPALADYGISTQYGFLPSEPPLDLLPDPYYADWEWIIGHLQALLTSRRIRDSVDRMPLLSTSYLNAEPEWRRAYVVLGFILHAYVWGGRAPAERIPPQLTVPLFAVCQHLDLPPVATFAGVCLWNYKPIFPDDAQLDLSNLTPLNTITGSLDEQWFYMVSVAIEARGGPAVPLMLQAIAAARAGNSFVVTDCLQQFAEILDSLGTTLELMYEHCDPHVFYHRIRPYLAGSKNMGDAGLPNGLLYDTGHDDPKPQYRQYGGGSNAQSSLIQFFDIVLGVEHRPTGEARPASADSDNPASRLSTSAPHHSFIHEMRSYMPGPHRRFLSHVSAVANIREYVESRRSDKALCIAYDASLSMLRALRDKHIQIVARYILVPSREARTSTVPPRGRNLASASEGKQKPLRGTGGTALIPFLKQARDETGEPAIDVWAKRLLSTGPLDGRFAALSKVGENHDGGLQVVGLSGTWAADDSEGGICHW
ncbi:indoleamine 2,3-dioxygenase [Aspergillus candidus]|uniref:Indoleamine 2,3-dioxygenase n=1 Tax=Aspergillus candidus TaxID=41067 RepID=A0A2I2F2E4_ASPCN|nr:indoleamine 2,3-dioxygenase subfamily [Aspergillus candidus]PLB34803.1 indoleamine 2,3-dioxygenase subfamily [Aspergillus candidus]